MDTWKFFDITHRDHIVCNPTSVAKLDEVIGLLDLPEGASVLDIASGKGEFLVRVLERYSGGNYAERRPGSVPSTAIDISPFCVAELKAKVRNRISGVNLQILNMDGAAYQAQPGAFDLAICLGASWVFGGHRGTLRYLREAVRPGGLVVAGEPFWAREPDPEFLAVDGWTRDEFGTHAGNVETGVEEGLVPWLALVSSGDEWDRYETLQWRAAARYAAQHPEDPDVPELLERVEKSRHNYLRWGRETLGWAVYLFAKPR